MECEKPYIRNIPIESYYKILRLQEKDVFILAGQIIQRLIVQDGYYPMKSKRQKKQNKFSIQPIISLVGEFINKLYGRDRK